jgi:ribonuclease J
VKAARSSLTFLNLGSPTGLKFTIETGDRRAIFDFGIEHAPGRALFSMGLEPRPGRELADLTAAGMAPGIQGVYDAWDGRTAVFISHLHLDHSGLVRFLHQDVPLYYPSGMEDLRKAAHRSGFAPWRDNPGTAIPNRDRVDMGGMEVEFVPVDHDLPGATGFLVRTPDLTIAYTGDHRWHGLRPGLTAAFAEAAKGVDVLIQEGVMLGTDVAEPGPDAPPPFPQLTEADVITEFDRIMDRYPGLVVVNLYPMNRDRVAGLGGACRRHGRQLLMDARAAAVAGWDGVLGDTSPVAATPDKYCVVMDFEMMPLLIDFRPPRGSAYVHSNGTPLGPFDPTWPLVEAWTERFRMELVRLPSTGHSRVDDIKRMVATIEPRVVLPVHSRAPELLVVDGIPTVLPEIWRPYTASDLLPAE